MKLLYPELDWTWHCCQQTRYLQLLSQQKVVVKTHLREKQLIPDAKAEHPFNLEHAQSFTDLQEQLDKPNHWSEQQLLEILINAIAIKHLMLPIMPKNWLFKSAVNQTCSLPGKIVWLKSDKSKTQFLTVDVEQDNSLVMLLDEQFSSGDSSFQRFSAFKVANKFISLVQ